MPITVELKNVSTETLTLQPNQTITLEVVSSPPPSGTLADAVSAWNSTNATSKVIASGTEGWSNTSPSSGNKDYLDPNPSHAVRQHGSITRVVFDVGGTVQVSGWKVKVWRKSGTAYSVVGESEAFTPSGFGQQTRDLTTPITGVQPGDFLGLYVPAGAVINTEYPASGFEIIYATGDNTALSSPTPQTSWFPRIVGYGPRPFAVCIGDSLMAGHGADFYRPFLDGGFSGNPAGEPPSHIRSSVTGFTYQNFGKGSQTWAWAVSNAPAIAALAPRAALCHFGVNDIALGRTWTQISADMASFKASLPTGSHMFVNEVLPWTSGSDTQAAAIRTLNANYATWCAANGATLIACHNAMGQVRSSTGEVDDLKTAYNHDGIHLTASGVTALAGLMEQSLDGFTW